MSKVRNRGVALVIVLAFVVLVAGLVVAYLARTGTDRQLAHGAFNENHADLLARSVLDIVVGDLKQEIVAGSTVTTVNNINIDLPSSAAAMLPTRSGNPSTLPDPIPNLVRRSWSNDTNLTIRSRASAVSSSLDVSLNGRSVTPARWNSHYLVPRANTSTAIDSTPVASFSAPDWVLVTRAGPSAKTSIGSGNSALYNSNPSNSAYVVGRYAYAIYDEGGLLDVNVVAFPYASPSPAPTPPVPPQPIYAPSPPYAQGSYPSGYTAATYTAQKLGRKGTAAFADLSVLRASASTFFPPSQINSMIGWRNYASAQPGSDFSNFTFDLSAATRYYGVALSNLATFLQTSGTVRNNNTDQAFSSRQQLLAFRNSTQFSQNLLQYLGTFSREYNRPSWKPATTSAINPDLSGIRVTTGFTRLDGTSAVVGEPLFKNRFALRRMSWLTYKGPSALRNFPPASPVLPITDPDYDMWQLLYNYGVPQTYLLQGTASKIKQAFGLVWDNRATTATVGSQWVYTSPRSANSGGDFDPVSNPGGNAASVVKTVTTIQAEGREPDFFEILKAVILNGSVGLGSSGTGGAKTFVTADQNYWDTTNSRSKDYQIIAIGANIIDECDIDNVPTFLNYGINQGAAGFAQQSTGIENLPYLSKLLFAPYYTNHGHGDQFYAWLVPSLWNPHQNTAAATGEIRFAMTTGSMTATVVDNKGNTFTSNPILGSSTTPYIQVLANAFAQPYPPATSPSNNITATSGLPTVSETFTSGTNYYGLSFPFVYPDPNNITDKSATQAYPSFAANTNFDLQINVGNSVSPIWRRYQSWAGCTQTVPPLACIDPKGAGGWKNNKLIDPEFVSIDPRTVRFGVWGSDANDTGKKKGDFQDGAEDSMDQSGALELIYTMKPQGSSFGSSGTAYYRYAANSVIGDQYTDVDGVARQGDWAADGIGTGSHKTVMYGPTVTDRPNLLSAPLQSVAELGQVFRDQPWKTLAFTVANSGDAGILDAFTMQDVSITGTAPSSQYVWMTAGRTSLNTRQAPVLTAIMSQVSKAIAGTGVIPTNSTDTTVSNISNALVSLTVANPMISKGELVTSLAADTSVTGLGNKEAREAVMRALSEAGQTRTWNLMIDVIAQSGRYPASATGLANFIVEGEKRYWLHVAIDRFTGEVIDQQLEAVYE
jgi:hypothetical protein